MDEINVFNGIYKLKPKDIFRVNLEVFLVDATLWSRSFQIVGINTYKRKYWWQFWKPRRNTFIKMMYLGGYENE